MQKIISLLVLALVTLTANAKPKTDAYLMVYFSDSDHCLHMAVSMDGYEFTAVNDNYPVIAGDTIAEQKGLRDPFILRGPDGTYYIAATDLHIFAKHYGYRTTEFERDQQEFGWGNNKNLALLKSKDLIHWEHSLVRVQQMEGFHDIGATWAPELIWDEKKNAVMIYWTIRRGNGACKLYYAYANKEFTDFATEPKLLFEKTIGDHTALDGDIVKGNDGRYYLHYAEYDEGFSGIMVAVSDNLTGPYTFQPEIIDKEAKACEAPNVWKRYGTDTYVLMYDCFGRRPHNFGFLETKDFKTYTDIGHFNEDGSKMKTTNFSSPKHGAVTPISKKDAQKLLDYWKKNPVHNDHGMKRMGTPGSSAQNMTIEKGLFEPTWESLSSNYKAPQWFADAKLGIWAHWGLQCVPERGDWYARSMYQQGEWRYKNHLEEYGHPSEHGMIDFIPMWKAEKFDPEALVKLYKEVGARYFVCMANHHDNFDNYNSTYQPWNSVNMGPKRDLVGEFEKAARNNGLRFGVSNHSSHAWHWFQTAYGYDATGPKAGVRYDAYNLSKEDGKGKWWEGYDPQQFYGGYNIVIPDGITSIEEMNKWHQENDRVWTERIPEMNPQFAKNWFLRCKELIDNYNPDLLYFDDEVDLPLGHYGLEITAHMYNRSMKQHDGKNEAIVNAKRLSEEKQKGIVMDCERGAFTDISPRPWQTDMCIGGWHYDRNTYERGRYKTAERIVKTFVDIVSKNGNLLLNIPVRRDGSIDDKEMAFLKDFKAWLDVHGEGIFGTRPWKVYGEGELKMANSHSFSENEKLQAALSAKDIRFTQTLDKKGRTNTIYAFVLGFPTENTVTIKSMGRKSATMNGKKISSIRMLGTTKKVKWKQNDDALVITMPDVPNTGMTICFAVK